MPELPDKSSRSSEQSEALPRADLERVIHLLSERAAEDSALRDSLKNIAAWLDAIADGPTTLDSKAEDDRPDALTWIAEFRSVVIPRTRLKADACRWVTERRHEDARAGNGRGQTHARERELIAAAKALPDCYLWMLRGVGDDISLESLAGSYECLADAIEVVLSTLEHLPEVGKQDLQAALSLLAEAVSAARYKILQVKERSDPDVDTAFSCIRRITQLHHIYIERHMRLNDPADPADWRQRRDRIEQTRRRLHERILYVRERPCLLTSLERVAATLAETSDADGATSAEKLETIAASIEQLSALGFDVSDPDLLFALVPAGEVLRRTEDLPASVVPVREALEAFLAEDPRRMTPWSRLQPRVESLLDGRWGILLTGTPSMGVQASLEGSLGLRKLHWIDAGSANVVPSLTRLINAPNTAIVLIGSDARGVVVNAVETLLEDRKTPVAVRIDPQQPDLHAIARSLVAQATPRLMQPVPTPDITIRSSAVNDAVSGATPIAPESAKPESN